MRRLYATVGVALCLACAHLGPSAYGEEIPRLTFAQLVDSIRANFEVTQTIKSYSGKEVEIQGFIIPAGPPDLSFFLLSRVSAMGNYCCEAILCGSTRSAAPLRRVRTPTEPTASASTGCVTPGWRRPLAQGSSS